MRCLLSVCRNLFVSLFSKNEHFGSSCLVKDSVSPAALMCKGNSGHLSRTFPTDVSELIILMFTDL